MSDEKPPSSQLLRQWMTSIDLTEEVDAELARTPERFAGLLHDLFTGLREAPPKLSLFPADEMSPAPVVMTGLRFQSMCVHHLLPFFGRIDVAYVPHRTVVGFGSIPRVIDHFGAKPQMQERLVKEIADYLEEHLQPAGLLIRCRARQLCMEYRGAKRCGELLSFASRGTLQKGEQRQELLNQFALNQPPL